MLFYFILNRTIKMRYINNLKSPNNGTNRIDKIAFVEDSNRIEQIDVKKPFYEHKFKTIINTIDRAKKKSDH